jgi:hypothetical protein
VRSIQGWSKAIGFGGPELALSTVSEVLWHLGRGSRREAAIHPICLDALSPGQLSELDQLYHSGRKARMVPPMPALGHAAQGHTSLSRTYSDEFNISWHPTLRALWSSKGPAGGVAPPRAARPPP